MALIKTTMWELIQALNKVSRDLPVLRADADWGGVEVKGVEVVEFVQVPGGVAWVNYYPELPHDEDQTYFKGVLIR
jgi:hypothetical protein